MALGKKTGGRAKGTTNKTSAQMREATALFLAGNIQRLNKWLDQIAVNDPKGAFQCFLSILEYHLPKLARTELTGKEGEPLQLVQSPRPQISREEWLNLYVDEPHDR